MDALELIKDNLDVERILEHYEFEGVRSGTKFSRAACKLHGGNREDSFVINNDEGLWTCHTQCGNGNIFQLVMKLENVGFKEAMHKVAALSGVSLENATFKAEEDYMREIKKWKRAVQKLNKKIDIQPYSLDVELRNVKKYRNFLESTLRHFELQFLSEITLPSDRGGMYKLHNRLTLPVKVKGITIGYALRKTREADFPKWSNQPSGFKSEQILYNYDACLGQDEFVICEGFFDVWAFYEIGINAVSTFGAHLTEEQYKLILRSGCTKVVLAFDGDAAGREATNKAIEKLRGKVDVYALQFNEGEDSEGVSRRDLRRLFQGRIRRA